MPSRNEELLEALLDEETVDIEPMTRTEAYLKACCEACGCEGLPEPISRADQLLYELAEKMAGGGGDVTVKKLTVTENGTYQETGVAYRPVVVNVPIPDPPSGSVNITENGTVDVSDYASAVVAVPQGLPIEVSTAAGMEAVLIAENVGKAYKFTGTTDSNFTNGDIYVVEVSA